MFLEGKSLELLIAAIVALIVVGPKDLPVLLRKLGQFMARLRGMAAEFRASFDEMARQSELDELRKEVEALRRGQLADMGQTSEIVGDIHQSLADVGVQLHPPMSYQYSPPPAEPLPPVSPPAVAAPKAPRARKAAAKPKAPAKSKAASARSIAATKAPAKPRARAAGPKRPKA